MSHRMLCAETNFRGVEDRHIMTKNDGLYKKSMKNARIITGIICNNIYRISEYVIKNSYKL